MRFLTVIHGDSAVFIKRLLKFSWWNVKDSLNVLIMAITNVIFWFDQMCFSNMYFLDMLTND